MKSDLLLIPMGARWVDLRAAAVAGEEAGFDGLWTWDHLRDPARLSLSVFAGFATAWLRADSEHRAAARLLAD